MICVTADRWGAGRGDGPCMLASQDADGWWRLLLLCIRRQCQIQCLPIPSSKAENPALITGDTSRRLLTPWGDYLICEVIKKRRAAQRLYGLDLPLPVLSLSISELFHEDPSLGHGVFCFPMCHDTVTGIARDRSISQIAYEHTRMMDLHMGSDPCGAVVQLLSR